jgi:hypothetical protein
MTIGLFDFQNEFFVEMGRELCFKLYPATDGKSGAKQVERKRGMN